MGVDTLPGGIGANLAVMAHINDRNLKPDRTALTTVTLKRLIMLPGISSRSKTG